MSEVTVWAPSERLGATDHDELVDGPRCEIADPKALVVGFCLVAVIACGGGTTPSAPTSPTATAPMPTPTPPPVQQARISGRVVSTLSRTPVGGAVVTVLSSDISYSSDASGQFTFDAPSGVSRVRVSAPGHLPRETSIRSDLSRDGLLIDLISTAAPFSLDFYRQLVRNKKDQPNAVSTWRLYRWTRAPRFRVTTLTANTGEIVSTATIQRAIQAATEAVPLWTGQVYQSAGVELTESQETVPRPGEILVRFWAGNVGTGTGPCGLSQYPTNNSSKIEVSISGDNCYGGRPSVAEQLDTLAFLVRHEVGHSLGFSHTDGGGQFGALGGAGCWTGTVPLPPSPACPPDYRQVSAIERHHAALAYARPPGNLDIDVDPVSPTTFSTEVALTVQLASETLEHRPSASVEQSAVQPNKRLHSSAAAARPEQPGGASRGRRK